MIDYSIYDKLYIGCRVRTEDGVFTLVDVDAGGAFICENEEEEEGGKYAINQIKEVIQIMKDIKINIPKDVLYILEQLNKYGYESYIVGGCLRDALLGREPHDYDITTSATPLRVMEIFEDEYIIPTGLQHGTVTIMLNGVGYEVTTFRKDGEYSDGRHPDSVEFTDDIVKDLSRRDFTINAMAYNPEVGLVDPFGGMIDIEYEKIRCVGFAKDRFEEDALRILRAIRFASQLEFSIMPDTDWEIHEQYKNLEKISIERINSEFCKIVMANDFPCELVLYVDVFEFIIPELHDVIECKQNNPYHIYDVFEHTIHAVEYCDSNDLITRLAVFFHDFGKPQCKVTDENGIDHFKGHGKAGADMVDNIMRRLRFDNETREKVVELVYYHDATFEVGEKYVKRWLNKIGEEQFRRLLEVRRADIKAQNPIYMEERLAKVDKIEAILEDVLLDEQCFSLKDLAINGNDLIELGFKPGKVIGSTLNTLLQIVIDGEVENDKNQLIRVAKVALKLNNIK
jgi:tRNA nucleotidyltransferase (CCA-adding enzyme)